MTKLFDKAMIDKAREDFRVVLASKESSFDNLISLAHEVHTWEDRFIDLDKWVNSWCEAIGATALRIKDDLTEKTEALEDSLADLEEQIEALEAEQEAEGDT